MIEDLFRDQEFTVRKQDEHIINDAMKVLETLDHEVTIEDAKQTIREVYLRDVDTRIENTLKDKCMHDTISFLQYEYEQKKLSLFYSSL